MTTNYAIGLPGHPPRCIMSGDLDDATLNAREGEVAVAYMGETDIRINDAGDGFEALAIDLPRLKTDALRALATIRYQRQQTCRWRDRASVAADDITVGRIVGAIQLMQMTGTTDQMTGWKFAADDWASLSFADLVEYGATIAAHMQGCFAREAQLTPLIADATDDVALAAIGLDTGWPE